jgi:aryl-alcohol dehydrogenase-like predicted oxidoreductase
MFEAYAEAGGNIIDTAVNYTDGASERIVGELIASQRQHFVVATKYTLSTDPSDPNASGNHRKNLVRSLERSLRQLGTDHIDLYWAHIWGSRTPIEETMRALDDAVRAGKILYVGFSDAPAWVVSRANTLALWRGWSPMVALQLQYNLVQRGVERELLPLAREDQMSVAAWSPLAGGLLSGKFASGAAPTGTRVDARSISERELVIASSVAEVAFDLGVSSSRVALAWTRAHYPNVHPIIGARRLDQLEDNLGALDVSLDDGALRELDRASAIDLGFPYDFIEETASFVCGEVGQLVDNRG